MALRYITACSVHSRRDADLEKESCRIAHVARSGLRGGSGSVVCGFSDKLRAFGGRADLLHYSYAFYKPHTLPRNSRKVGTILSIRFVWRVDQDSVESQRQAGVARHPGDVRIGVGYA